MSDHGVCRDTKAAKRILLETLFQYPVAGFTCLASYRARVYSCLSGIEKTNIQTSRS